MNNYLGSKRKKLPQKNEQKYRKRMVKISNLTLHWTKRNHLKIYLSWRMIKKDCEVGFWGCDRGSDVVTMMIMCIFAGLAITSSPTQIRWAIIETNRRCDLTWMRWQVDKGSMSDWMYYESLTFGEQVKRYRRRRCRHLWSRWMNSSRRKRRTRPLGELNVVYSNITPPNTNRGFNLYLKNYNWYQFRTLLLYSLYWFHSFEVNYFL